MAVQTVYSRCLLSSVYLLIFYISSLSVMANSDFEVFDDDALMCYKCSGYDSSTIDNCLNDPSSVSTKQRCPTEVAGELVFPSCHKTQQTAAGKITSVTRGCLYHFNCTEISTCQNLNQTGVCVNCCDDRDFCNTASTSHPLPWVVMATSLLLSFLATKQPMYSE